MKGPNMLSTKLSRLIKHALWMGTAAVLSAPYCSTALAADAADKDADTSMDEVVVTGSLIRLPKNMTSTSPVQVVDSEEIKLSGKNDITDLINQLPQIFSNDIGQDLGNRTPGLSTPGGVSTADLRGLGPNRTLVLINGRRVGVGSPNTAIQSPAPDLDQIPSALIDRVEVSTGGASATYGSDAIAGVVNFILKKNFQGVQFDYVTGANWHQNHNTYMQNLALDAGITPKTGTSHDGKNVNATVVMGTNFADDAGNVTAYLGYLKNEAVPSGNRDFGACQLNVNDDLASGSCGGSANSNWFQLSKFGGTNNAYQVSGNQFVPWGTADTNPPAVFNSQPYIDMSRDDIRYTAGITAHLDVNNYFKPYFDFNFMNDRSKTLVAPSALFKDSNPLDAQSFNYNVNCSNPLLSTEEALTLCTQAQIDADALKPGSVSANVRIGRRNVEGGGRIAYFEHTNFRGAVGFTGDVGAWNYDVYGQYYYTSFYNSNQRFLNFAAIDDALQVTKDANGNPVCISGSSTCVPYNIFTEGGVTQDQLANMYLDGTAFGTSSLRTIHADISGDLGQYNIKLPTAKDGIAVALGYEFRSEGLSFAPDSGELSGLLSGFGSASVAIDRQVSVTEEFAEVRVPLVQNITGVKDLVFDTAYRRSDYQTSGVTNTYKFEVQYAPVSDVRFRGSWNRAIRAPSIIELYNPQNVGLIAFGTDPCAPTVDSNNNLIPAKASASQCANEGVTAAQYGNGGTTNTIPQGTGSQLSQLTGGNPDLKPETADTYTIGFTFTPTFLPNLTGSIDYYHIKITNLIGVSSPTTAMADCLATGNPASCSLIVRSKNTGGLNSATIAGGGYFIQTGVNFQGANDNLFSGIDVQAAYKLDLPHGAGALFFALNGAYMLKNESTSDGASSDCAGLFGSTCQTVNSRWRHNLMMTWHSPVDVDVSLKWRYLSAVSLDNNDPNPAFQGAEYSDKNGPLYDYFNARIPSFSYFDLAAEWKINKAFAVRGGINNILDKDPPLISSDLAPGGAANTYGIYDAMGRQWFVGVTAKF